MLIGMRASFYDFIGVDSSWLRRGQFFLTGSQVRSTPSFLNILRSTSPSMMVVCACSPARAGSCARARRQFSSWRLRTLSATSTSSVWRRGLWPPRYSIFVRWMGSMKSCEMSFSSWSMPARCFVTLRRSDDAVPSRGEEAAVFELHGR